MLSGKVRDFVVNTYVIELRSDFIIYMQKYLLIHVLTRKVRSFAPAVCSN